MSEIIKKIPMKTLFIIKTGDGNTFGGSWASFAYLNTSD